MKREYEKEWFYVNASGGEKQGPFGYDEVEALYLEKKVHL